ncbi:hypothetical protein BDZ97DRAFT_958171 [Flammula alnicola]|nr:hypothetical protein BDZ97DRAFT_958171 [Flammula alnicola]
MTVDLGTVAEKLQLLGAVSQLESLLLCSSWCLLFFIFTVAIIEGNFPEGQTSSLADPLPKAVNPSMMPVYLAGTPVQPAPVVGVAKNDIYQDDVDCTSSTTTAHSKKGSATETEYGSATEEFSQPQSENLGTGSRAVQRVQSSTSNASHVQFGVAL